MRYNAYIIDVNTHFGTLVNRNIDLSLATLLNILESNRISIAFSYALKGVYYDYNEGNRETLETTKTFSNLLPIATIDPRRYLGLRSDLEKLKDNFKCVRFFPHIQNWDISSISFIELCQEISRLRLPIMISAKRWGDSTKIAEIASKFDLTVILSDINYSLLGEAISVVKNYPHIYIETNCLSTPDGIENLVSQAGAKHILFGSNTPFRPIQSALNMVLNSRISDKQKEMILCKNVAELFSIVNIDCVFNKNRIEVELPYNGPIIDTHGNLGSWPFPIRSTGVKDILSIMQKNNIEKCILVSVEAITYDFVEGNKRLEEAIRDEPSLFGYVVLNPNYPERSCEEMHHYYRNKKFIGAKINCEYSQKPTVSPEVFNLISEVAKGRKPLLIHNWGENWMSALREIAKTFPKLYIISAHGAWRGVEEVFADVPNVMFDFATSHPERGVIREIRRKIDSSRFVFGSDINLVSPASMLGAYQDAGFNSDELRMIMYDNAKRIFDF